MADHELNLIIMPDGSLQPEWNDTIKAVSKKTQQMQKEMFGNFTSEPESWLLKLGFCDKNVELSPSFSFFRRFSGLFIQKLSRTPDLESLRQKAEITISDHEVEELLSSAPLMTGGEYLNPEILNSIWEELCDTFSRLIKKFDGTVAAFVRNYSPHVHLAGRIFFHLVENKDDDFPFAFLATYSKGLNDKGKSKHLPLKNAIKEYGSSGKKMLELLSTVTLAAEKSELVSQLVETGELFHPLAWSSGEALLFLNEVFIYEESGILCRIPDWWKGKSSGVRLDISMGGTKPSFLGLDAVLDFKPQLLLGDTKISLKEAKKILDESEGLAFIKNKWVAVDPEKLRKTIDAYEKAQEMMEESGIGIRDALRMQLKPETLLDIHKEDADVTISSGKWLESVMKKLTNPKLIPAVKPGRDFKAKLREYQKKGLSWLFFLHSLKFGACLADDMGLGKTVQVLGFLNVVKSNQPQKDRNANLIIIPASLISNWTNEIERFYPDLKYYVAHPGIGQEKKVKDMNDSFFNSIDLVITTYALIQKYDIIKNYSWNYIILDEAQAIKNPGTKQTRAVKKLKAENRIVMTGTPVENRLSDLWSIFDFLNPGLLGNKAEFGRFIKTLKNNSDGYSRLRKIISPYILRRLKTDKSVISDLPDKVEMKTYADLSKKQIVLYKQIIEDLKRTIEDTSGIQKKGLVLASLMKFKQICNHPDQFLGTGDYREAESGKFVRLREICETIYEKREKVLVFTQFREITEYIADFLEQIFQRPGLVLHGSIPVGKRKKIIEKFQSDQYIPFMVLSLKAGGVGLNLTQANHVIHFDRWWNPAVEDQATDRAFRIGQKKNVVVHKFLTRGTLEERIDMMLEEKKNLSKKIISSTGETLITEMDNDELLNLCRLTL